MEKIAEPTTESNAKEGKGILKKPRSSHYKPIPDVVNLKGAGSRLESLRSSKTQNKSLFKGVGKRSKRKIKISYHETAEARFFVSKEATLKGSMFVKMPEIHVCTMSSRCDGDLGIKNPAKTDSSGTSKGKSTNSKHAFQVRSKARFVQHYPQNGRATACKNSLLNLKQGSILLPQKKMETRSVMLKKKNCNN